MPISHKHIVVLGASSDMALALFHEMARQGWANNTLYLLARSTDRLKPLADELAAKNTVSCIGFDLEQTDYPSFARVHSFWCFAGWLPSDNAEPEKSYRLNFSAIKDFTEHLLQQHRDSLEHILLIGSMAGVRVRPSNHTYGAPKQALHQYSVQLRRQLAPACKVSLVIPGYVSTRMLPHKTPRLLTLQPQQMARLLLKTIQTKPDVIYSQQAWRLIAGILRWLPQWVIAKLK
jgi:short-subunit dehydrogenase